MDDMKIGGYGANGCSCAVQFGNCPVHAVCPVCRTQINNKPSHKLDGKLAHLACIKRGKAIPTTVDVSSLPPEVQAALRGDKD